MLDLYATAKKLTEAPSPSGFEYMAHDTVRELCEHYFESVQTMPTGSVIGYRPCGKPGAKKLIIDAHLDEIGMVVKEICDGGFVRVVNLGGVDTRVLCASEVWIYGKERIPGVFCAKPPHLMNPGDEKKKFNLPEMYIDTGLPKEKLEQLVTVGTPAGFKTTVERLQNNYITGKGFDDKICATSIIRAIDMLKDEELDVDIYVVFAGGEEIGYIGARNAGFLIDADFAIVIDVTNAYIPEAPAYKKCVRMNKGGVISISDTTSRALSKAMLKAVREAGIDVQVVGEPGYTYTNATAHQISRAGVPSVLISIPLKNMHTPSEVVSLDDVERTAAAVAAFVKTL